jgi:hypothetical protein
MQLFGQKFEEIAQAAIKEGERRGKVTSLLSELPMKFTRNELIALRARHGQSTAVKMIISRWVKAGFIAQEGNNEYRKTSKAFQ